MTVSRLFCLLLAFTLGFNSYSQAAAIQCRSIYADPNSILRTQYGDVVITSEQALSLLKDQRQIFEAKQLKDADRKSALQKYFLQKPATRTELMMTLANYAMAMIMGSQIAARLVENPHAIPAALALVPVTLFTTDFVSGIYHKFLDSYASEKSKIWGNATQSFRKHHEFPGNLNDIKYIDNIGAFGTLMAPLYATAAIASPHLSPEIGAQALLMLMLFTNGTEIHRQAHLPKANRVMAQLQKWKIFQSRTSHNMHHKGPADSDFGIINGWSNSLTNQFWKRLDMIVWKASKKMPNNWIENPKSIPPQVLVEMMNDIRKIPQALIVAVSDPKNSNAELDQILQLWVNGFPPGDNSHENN